MFYRVSFLLLCFFCTASKRQRVCFHCFAFLDCIKKRRVGYLLSPSWLGGCPICFNPAYIRLVSLAAWDMIWMKHVYMVSLLLLQHWWMKDERHNGESVTNIVCFLFFSCRRLSFWYRVPDWFHLIARMDRKDVCDSAVYSTSGMFGGCNFFFLVMQSTIGDQQRRRSTGCIGLEDTRL